MTERTPKHAGNAKKIEGGVKLARPQEDVKFFSANKSYLLVEYLLHILDGHNYP